MGSPGAVDRDHKTVTGAFNLNWKDTQEVGSVIEKETGIPFAIDNDANVAALGERWIGAGENNPDVVFMTLGTGVGGGIVADGNLIHGVAGAGGEIGHMIVEPENGFACTCGSKGCLETVASATGVVKVARLLAESYEGDSSIKAAIDNGDAVSSKDIFEAAQAGDAFANSVVDKVSFYLGLASANISNILNPEVGSVIEKETGIPFAIDNDANVAALGERWIGAGENNPDVVFMTLGTGVGGGIVADGNLIHGVAGAGGEIGHMIVEPENGFACTCGSKGCLETVASATGVVKVARLLAESYEGDSSIKAAIDNGDAVSSKDIFEAAQAGDAFANSVVDKVSFYLGLASANISNILNPDSVVIGGGVSAAGEFLRSRVESNFQRFTFPQVRQSTKIKIAELGNDAGIIGAASLASQFVIA